MKSLEERIKDRKKREDMFAAKSIGEIRAEEAKAAEAIRAKREAEAAKAAAAWGTNSGGKK